MIIIYTASKKLADKATYVGKKLQGNFQIVGRFFYSKNS